MLEGCNRRVIEDLFGAHVVFLAHLRPFLGLYFVHFFVYRVYFLGLSTSIFGPFLEKIGKKKPT